ncbi:YkvA family protein [Caldimonas sp. KR1-144]|uniref:YkvA family protein n=1 Tax=Caldimonas sp. KR1-144 TaxID=3400911 RepID=UPI003C04CCF7
MKKLRRLFGAAHRARLGVYLLALWKLLRHPQTPWLPKAVALFVLAYALSPIDLIPDFIPVLGLLDELILVPLGIALAVKLTPAPLWQARLAEAEASGERAPKLVWGALLIVAVWLLCAGLFGWWLWGVLARA